MNFYMNLFSKNIKFPYTIFHFSIWFFNIVRCSLIFDRNLSYIIYSPYTSFYNLSRLPPVTFKSKSEYSIEDIKGQLSTIRGTFTSVITLGMGVTNGNMDYNWNQTHSECLISTAAAYLNLNTEDDSNHLKIIQGIRISNDDTLSSAETTNAIKAIMNANRIFPNTVQSVLINFNSIKEEFTVRKTIRKHLSYSISLPYGIRMSYSLCEKLLFPSIYPIDAKFLICIVKQNTHSVPSNFENDIKSCEKLKSNAVPGKTQVICEFDSATTGLLRPFENSFPDSDIQVVNDFIGFWQYIVNWNRQASSPFVINEAFDQPEQCVPHREPTQHCHRGIWLPFENKYMLKTKLLDELDQGGSYVTIVSMLSLSGIAIVLIAAGLIWLKRRAISRQQFLDDKEYEEFKNGLPDAAKEDETLPLSLPYNKKLLELPKSAFKIEMSHILGMGNFGTVFKGNYLPTNTTVAFKTINHMLPCNLRNFLSELKVISYIGKHPNVVCLIGAYTKEVQKGKIYIVLEYCSNGSLQNYLRQQSFTDYSHKIPVEESLEIYEKVKPTNDPAYVNVQPKSTTQSDLQENQLTKWTYELTSAMAYLETKKVIHGDLATRNILLNSKYESKLTDFGLSRRLYEYTDYVKTSKDPLPWRWMPPESLTQMHFSTKSDVWSYGVVVWEIFTLGDIPYPGLNYTTDFPDQLESGLRLPKPEHVSDELFMLMQTCWESSPNERPDFCDILRLFPATELAHIYSNIQK